MPPRSPLLRHSSLRRLRGALVLGMLGAALACVGTSIDEVRELQESGAFSESIQPLQRILAVAPAHPEANYRLALALLRTGRPQPALWYLRKAADSDEFGTPAGLVLASRFFAAGRMEEAVAAADQILERDPRNPAARLSRARAALAAGRPESALEDADTFLRLRPEHLAAHSIRANALAALGRWDDAHASFRTTYVLAREQESPIAGRKCVVMASAFARQGDSTRAVQEIRVCLEEHADPQTVSQAMHAYDQIGLHDASLELEHRARARQPDDPS